MTLNIHQGSNTLPTIHWRFPEAAKFGRVIPKEKLYQQAGVSASLKQRFVEQVGQIKWAYKLAEGTINLTKTESVAEIEIIEITLRSKDLDENILAAIDKAIPHPTLFVLKRFLNNQGGDENEQMCTEQICITAAHKTKANTSSGKETWQQSQYLNSAWLQPTQVTARPLPTATNLQRLYEQLLEALIPDSPERNTKSTEQNTSNTHEAPSQVREPKSNYNINEKHQTESIDLPIQTGSKEIPVQLPIEEKLATLAEIDTLSKKLNQVKAKRDKEKQFNRRRELNDDYKTLKQQLAKLQASI